MLRYGWNIDKDGVKKIIIIITKYLDTLGNIVQNKIFRICFRINDFCNSHRTNMPHLKYNFLGY
jgi:hypothetical protein